MFKEDEDTQSYICDVCHHTDTASDIYIDNTEQKECFSGHNFCQHHIGHVKISTLDQIAELFADYVGDNSTDNSYGIMVAFNRNHDIETVIKDIAEASLRNSNSSDNGFSDIFCPICNLREISDHDLLNYILNTRKLSRATIMEEIKTAYGDYESLEASDLLNDKESRSNKYGFELCLEGYTKEEITLAALYGWIDNWTEWKNKRLVFGYKYQDMFNAILAFVSLDCVTEENSEQFVEKLLRIYFADYEPEKMFAMYQKNKLLKKLE